MHSVYVSIKLAVFPFVKSPSVWKREYVQMLLVRVLKGIAFLERSKAEVWGLYKP